MMDAPPVEQCSAYVEIIAVQKQGSELALAAAKVRMQQLERENAELKQKMEAKEKDAKK